MSDVLNPADIEDSIRTVSSRMAKGVTTCSQRYAAFLESDRAYDKAYAAAYLEHEGPAHEKRYAAELATQDQRATRDEADALYRYADRQARALEAELRALQSLGASIRAQYGVAGRGEGA